MFNEGVEFCKENGASDPTTVLHGESTCSCRVELKAPISMSWRCARSVAVCEMREVTSVEEGHDVERVTETM